MIRAVLSLISFVVATLLGSVIAVVTPLFDRTGEAVMGAGRFIFIDRQNPVAARRSIDEAARRIKAGQSVVIFPEGTRTRDGRLGSFKKGGFHLAIDSGADIVPMAIQGSRELMPPGSPLIRSGQVRLQIGEP